MPSQPIIALEGPPQTGDWLGLRLAGGSPGSSGRGWGGGFWERISPGLGGILRHNLQMELGQRVLWLG